MGDLNNIQYEISEAMLEDLADVTYPFTATKAIVGSYDPENPTNVTVQAYSGTGIFGLNFNKQDSEIFQIEQNDQKSIIVKANSSGVPENNDDIIYDGASYRVIHVLVLPADNGWVLQLRMV